MTRTSPRRCDDTPLPEPLARPLADIAGDIRDRLTVLLNATQVIRYACPEEDPHFQSVIQLVEQQVHFLRELTDELCQAPYPEPASVAGYDGTAAPESASVN